jgi:hypothetical protein
MELLAKLERQILTWAKGIPHLPLSARQWLGENIWWIALVGAILTGIAGLLNFIAVMGVVSVLGTVAAAYYATASITSWAIVTGLVNVVFIVLIAVALAAAVKPLQAKQKKGWVLLFASWLLSAAFIVVGAVISLNPFDFIVSILFGAIGLAASGYILFELHGQFAHVEKSKGVKAKKAN